MRKPLFAFLLLAFVGGCPSTPAVDTSADDAPSTDVPRVDAPSFDAPRADTPLDAPATDIGLDTPLDAPATDTGLDAPSLDAPAPDAPLDAPSLDTPDAPRCSAPADCPGSEDECRMNTCVGGSCGSMFTADGTALRAQTAGDCRRVVCDGAGSTRNGVDDGDVPDDGSDCTSDTCTAGVPGSTPLDIRTPCAAGICDGAGTCVACLAASDCPGADTECAMRTCSASRCGVAYAGSGTPLGAQTAGDCRRAVCDGMGGFRGDVDGLDVPVDGNPCTADVCVGGVPSNPPVPDGTPCPGGTCNAGGICVTVAIASVDYPVAAHGGRLVVTGSGFTGATSITIGGVAQTFVVDSATQITVASLTDTTPIGAQTVVVTAPAGTSSPFPLTVIHLVVNELDSDTPGTDTAELVEIATGVPGVSLAGYVLVFWNGSTDVSYLAVSLAATTDAAGLLLVGNGGVVPTPAVTFTNNTLQNGQDAVAIYQGSVATFPMGTAVTASGLIDALVYDTADADDPGLLSTLLGLGPDAIQVDEGMSPSSEGQSIQRCAPARRDGRRFAIAAPTAGAANSVAACP